MTLAARPAEDDAARHFRIRVLIATPPRGQRAIMRTWLDEACGPACWGSASAGLDGVVNDAVAFYFVKPDDARAFINRFCCGYRVGEVPRYPGWIDAEAAAPP